MNCPGCDKEGAYTEENDYEILYRGTRAARFLCEDCGEKFWWP